MRVVFLGSPPFATPILARLIESPHRPAAVVTPPDRPRGRGRAVSGSPVAGLAEEAGLELLRPARARDADLLERLRALAPDVMLVASYGELLPNELLEVAPCLNVHGSVLPRHRGASPIQAAILAGDETTGVSIQRVVEELDAGDVLLSLETPIGAGETAGELYARLAELGAEAAVRALDLVASGEAVYTPQDPALVTHCRKLKKEHGRIHWSQPASLLERHVRAMNPWPAATTGLPDGHPLKILRVRIAEGAGTPGEILESEVRLVVAAGSGALELLEVQSAGKRAMPVDAFLRGTPLVPGEGMSS